MLALINNLIITNNSDLNHNYYNHQTLNCEFFKKNVKDTREDYIMMETSEFILQEDSNLIEIEF